MASLALFLPVHFFSQARSANLSSVSVTLSTARLSFSGIEASGNSVGASEVILNTTPGAAPSTSAANLFEGDSVLVGSRQYKVASPSMGARFPITGHDTTPSLDTLQAGDADAGDRVIASRSAAFTARFTTATAIPNGAFRILVPAASSNANDALPDQTGWDYGGGPDSNVTVACPSDVNSGGHDYDFVTGIASASALTRNGQVYHTFTCKYSGTGGTGTTFNGSTFDPMVVNQRLINPAPAAAHSLGTGDTYRIIVEHLNGFTDGDDVADSTSASVAVIESVLVTATISPQITFQVAGISGSTSRCGITTAADTSATSVPFGQLSVSAFRNLAQQLLVSTNASGGYAVTTTAANQLRRSGEACLGDATTGGCIPDSRGDNNAMTQTTPDAWTNTGVKGFAYSLEDNTVGAGDMAFTHNSASGTCTGAAGNCWRQFADTEDGQSAVQIFNSATVADNENVYVCYRAIVSSSQQPGTDYATTVTYRATATF